MDFFFLFVQYSEDFSDLQVNSYYCKLMTTVFESLDIQINRGATVIKIITFNKNTFLPMRFFVCFFAAGESWRSYKIMVNW